MGLNHHLVAHHLAIIILLWVHTQAKVQDKALDFRSHHFHRANRDHRDRKDLKAYRDHRDPLHSCKEAQTRIMLALVDLLLFLLL